MTTHTIKGTHVIKLTPERVLFLANWRYQQCRFWFCTNGHLTGQWVSKSGRRRSVGMNIYGQTIIYR